MENLYSWVLSTSCETSSPTSSLELPVGLPAQLPRRKEDIFDIVDILYNFLSNCLFNTSCRTLGNLYCLCKKSLRGHHQAMSLSCDRGPLSDHTTDITLQNTPSMSLHLARTLQNLLCVVNTIANVVPLLIASD